MALALPSFVRFFNDELEREWEVSRDGAVVHQRTDGRPDAEDLGTEKAAVLTLRRLVLEHLDDGFGLEGALPRFDQPSGAKESVAADGALEWGDARGELTHALARLTAAEAKDWATEWDVLREVVRQHRSRMGPSPSGHELTRRCDTTADFEALARDLRAPSGLRVRRLEVSSPLALQPLLDALTPMADSPLRELCLDSTARHLGDLGPLLATRPRVQSLRLTAKSFELGPQPLALTRLVVRPHQFLFTGALKSLKAPVFPALRLLNLEVTVPDEIFDWLFSGAHFPALLTLRLGLSFNDATARLLPLLTKKAKLFKRLTRLDLLGRFSYERLGEFREVAHVLAGIPHVGIGVSMEGAQFSRLQSLIPGLERIPTAAR